MNRISTQNQVVHRVRRRIEAGGHDVPEKKIRGRYARLWAHVAAMVEFADVVGVFDNSGDGPRTVALFIAGEPVGHARWPAWAPTALVELAG